jgi:hypothetical protein
MRHALRNWFSFVCCLLLALPVLAQDVGSTSPNVVQQKQSNAFVQAIKDLFSELWFVGLFIALIVLVIVYFVIKKKQADDDD